jgi:predicted NodU family carbamoyl transferase
MNCKLVGEIKASNIFKNVYIGPSVKDSGTSVGAGLLASIKDKKPNILHSNPNPFLGTEITGFETIWDLINAKFKTYSNSMEELIVNDLVANRTIALAVGRLEFGPRALGNRSILCFPNDIVKKNHINKTIKKRYSFQPFALSTLFHFAKVLFILIDNEPYMTTAVIGNIKAIELSQGTLHEDLTCRIHTVDYFPNSLIFKVLWYMKERGLFPGLLNTSFNRKGEPLPRSAYDALVTYLEIEVDVLYSTNIRVEIPSVEKKNVLLSLENEIKRDVD